MARPRTTPAQRIEQRSEWDENNHHLIWTGPLHRGKPFLRPEGHPVRILLQVHDHRIYVRRVCSHELCINPEHHRVQITQDHKYGDIPPPVWVDPNSVFTPREEEEINETAQALRDGEMPIEDLEYLDEHIREEIRRRCPDCS